MKKIFVILILIPLFSCTDWLDVESEKSVTYINYFKSEEDLEKVLVAILGYEKALFAPFRLDAFGWSGLLCDDAGYDEGYRQLDPNDYFSKSQMEAWSNHYSLIYLANMLEENRFRFENISKERADYWLAQANFAKALAYFNIAQKWGDAPLAPSTESIDAVGKSSVDTILAEAIRNAEKALILPPHEELTDAYGDAITSRQYASLGSVHTLLANIYAWMGGLHGEKGYWQKAEEHASLVIDNKVGYYDLENDISLLVTNTLGKNRATKETIFAIEVNSQDDNRYWVTDLEERYPGLGLVNYPHNGMAPGEIEDDETIARIRVSTVEKIFPERNDQRRKEYWYELGEVAYPGIEWEWDDELEDYVEKEVMIISDYAFINKWRDPIKSENPYIIGESSEAPLLAMEGNRVVWRLADLILLRAECRARLQKASAVDDLDRIRKRAGLENYGGSTEPERLRKEIFRERERELFGEGQRYYDVVRNGYVREELSAQHAALSDEDIKNGALYLPVGRRSFEKNPLMKQNTYWLWRQE